MEYRELTDELVKGLYAEAFLLAAKAEEVTTGTLKLLKRLNDYEKQITKLKVKEGINKVLLQEGQELTKDIIAELGKESEIVFFPKEDK